MFGITAMKSQCDSYQKKASLRGASLFALLLVLGVLPACRSGISIKGGPALKRCDPATVSAGCEVASETGGVSGDSIGYILQHPPVLNNFSTINLTLDDQKISKYRYKVVKGNEQSCQGEEGYGDPLEPKKALSANVDDFEDGLLTVCIIAKSLTGVWQETANATAVSWTKKTLPPGPFDILSPSSLQNLQYPEIEWSSSKNASGYSLKIATGPDCSNAIYAEDIGLTFDLPVIKFKVKKILPEQVPLHVCILARDGIGNVAPATNYWTYSFSIDTEAPLAPVVSSSTVLTNNRRPIWTWTSGGSLDAAGVYRYRLDNSVLDGTAEITSTASFTPTADLAAGDHVLYVSEKDPYGNWSSAGTRTIRVENSPAVQSVTSTTVDGFYTVGALISVTVNFSRGVTVSGTPLMSLDTGRNAAYVSGSGSASLVFGYTVQGGDTSSDLNYDTVNSLILNGGTIIDALAGGAADLTLPSTGSLSALAGFKAIVVDTTAPAVPTGLNISAARESLTVSWAAGDATGAGFMVVRRQGASVTWVPVRGTSYSTGATGVAGESIVYTGSSLSQVFGSLPILEEFYFSVYAYDAARNYSTAALRNAHPTSGATWITNSSVRSLAKNAGTMYLGGYFSAIGPRLGGGVAVGPTSAANLCTSLSEVFGTVRASVWVPSGGWIIGGDFLTVGASSRSYIARLNADCSVHSFNPTLDNRVRSLHVIGSTVYVGGDFLYVNSVLRPYFIALDLDTGLENQTFSSRPGNYVETIKSSGSDLYLSGAFNSFGTYHGGAVSLDASGTYNCTNASPINGTVNRAISDGSGGWFVGGTFSAIGTSSRGNLAHINADCSLDAWDPGVVNGVVNSMVKIGTTLYFGGSFTSVAGAARAYLAAVHTGTAALQSWDPSASSVVYALALDGTTIYAGGAFSTIGGLARTRIAAIDSSTGVPSAWIPSVNNSVRAIVVDTSLIYIGGDFTSAGGSVRTRLASLNKGSNTAGTWDPVANGSVGTMALSGSNMYVGGSFTTVSGLSRSRLAVIPVGSNTAGAWNPVPTSSIYCLTLIGSNLYVGGNFSTIAGTSRRNLAAFDAATGTILSWNPSANSYVYSISPNGTGFYVGGSSKMYNALSRGYAARIDAVTGTLSSWDPQADNQIHDLAIGPNNIVIGGAFSKVGGLTRDFLAAVDPVTAAVSSWNALADDEVIAVEYANGDFYVGGYFYSIGGSVRTYLAAFDDATLSLSSWAPVSDGDITKMGVSGTTLYVSGYFTIINGLARSYVAAFDTNSGNMLSWAPCSFSPPLAIAVSPTSIYLGSPSMSTACVSRRGLAALDGSSGEPTAWNPLLNGNVESLTVAGGTLYAGGSFTSAAGQTRNRAASFDLTTTALTAWNPNLGSTVRTIHLNSGNAYLGGQFTTVGGTARSYLARVDGTTGALNAWTPAPNNTVYAITSDGTNLFAGGAFTSVTGGTRNRAASWSLASNTLTSWDPNFSATVYTLIGYGSQILAGGSFATIGGTARIAFGSVSATGTGSLNSLNLAISSGSVYSLVLNGDVLNIGGGMGNVAGAPRPSIAQYDLNLSALLPLNPSITGTVNTLFVDGGYLWAGGNLSTSAPGTSLNLGKVEVSTGALK